MGKRLSVVLTLLVAFNGAMYGQQSWFDSSSHKVQYVNVDNDVQLEVLDWGGSGRHVVLLAGLGNTAHVFDEFATILTGSYHVFGFTRRGYGFSSHPESGYTATRLADDVVAALEALGIKQPVLIGHSYAGEELTVLATRHSDRIAAVVYMDAAADRTPTAPALTNEQIDAFNKQYPRNIRPMSAADRISFLAVQAYWRDNVVGVTLPESEMHQMFTTTADDGVGRARAPNFAGRAALAGVEKPAFEKIRVPVLSFESLRLHF